MISLFAHSKNYCDGTTMSAKVVIFCYILTKTVIIYNNITLKKLNQSFY